MAHLWQQVPSKEEKVPKDRPALFQLWLRATDGTKTVVMNYFCIIKLDIKGAFNKKARKQLETLLNLREDGKRN